MAKKSARSKGYRTYKKTKTGFTEKEKKTMIIGAIAIVVILICVLVVPDLIEKTHLLKVKDGVVQDVGDNWLISNVGTSSKKKYRKLAEVSPIDGYSVSKTETGLTDDQERIIYFAADDENAAVQEYYAFYGKGEYNELAASSLQSIAAFNSETLDQTDVTEAESNGLKIAYYVIEYASTDSSDEENPVTTYTQTVNMYVESNVSERCLILSSNARTDDPADFPERDQVIATLTDAVSGIVLAK